MRRFFPRLTVLLLVLAACTALEPGALGRDEAGAPDATATARPPAGLGLVTADEEAGTLRGRPVDGRTLADVAGVEAVDCGHHYTYAVSPDGRTMALIAWPSGSHNGGGALRIVDLLSWEVAESGVTFDGHVSSLRFSVDGDALYWPEPGRRDTAHGVPRAYSVYRYELGSAGVDDVAALPPSFMPWEMRLLPAGERLAIYGVPTDASYLAAGPPRVLLVDLATGEVAADVALEGVAAGQFRVETETADQHPYRMVHPALAWNMGRSLLYVVHGDENKVTVVDLEEGTVQRQTEVRPRQSLLERILGWAAKTAAAKVVPSTDKQAALSPDGRRLYVTGLSREMRPDWQEEGWPYEETPLGLQVIDTAMLAEVGRLDLPATELALSPDGRWLLLTGAYSAAGEDGESERVAHGLYLVEAAGLEVAVHLLPGEEVYLQGFSGDGRRAYVNTATSEWLEEQGGYGNWRVTLQVVELEAGALAVGRTFSGSFLDVISDQ